jgi:acetylornithine deacetylase/succinyl-diaminopimelate desuccinylase-like protein
VPDQDPRAIVPLVRAHLDAHGFSDIEIIVHDDVVRPIRAAAGHWFIGEARTLLEKHFERPAIVQPSSAASGTAHPFVEHLGATVVGVGLTHHGAMLHSPNENIVREHFVRMVSFSAELFEAMTDGRSVEPAGRSSRVRVSVPIVP